MAALSMRHDRRFLQGSRCNGARQLPGETGLAEKFSFSQNRNDGFFALAGEHGELDVASQDIEHRVRRIPLRKEDLSLPAPQNLFPAIDLRQECLGVERRGAFASHAKVLSR